MSTSTSSYKYVPTAAEKKKITFLNSTLQSLDTLLAKLHNETNPAQSAIVLDLQHFKQLTKGLLKDIQSGWGTAAAFRRYQTQFEKFHQSTRGFTFKPYTPTAAEKKKIASLNTTLQKLDAVLLLARESNKDLLQQLKQLTTKTLHDIKNGWGTEVAFRSYQTQFERVHRSTMGFTFKYYIPTEAEQNKVAALNSTLRSVNLLLATYDLTQPWTNAALSEKINVCDLRELRQLATNLLKDIQSGWGTKVAYQRYQNQYERVHQSTKGFTTL